MRQQRGFTLIELMIVVIVIAVLAAIAIPNYLEQSRKGRRAEAARAIGEYQLAMERWRAENPSYANCTGTGCGSGTYPATPTSDHYTMTPGTPTPTAYSITAAPTAGGKQVGDRCGNLSATNLAKPTWSGDADCNN
jgi:type IV pilus assembly protein PilE